MDVVQTPPEPKRASTGLVIAAYVCAFLMPVIGFVLGSIVAVRHRAGHGITATVISGIVLIGYLALAASAPNQEPDYRLNKLGQSIQRCLVTATTQDEVDACVKGH